MIQVGRQDNLGSREIVGVVVTESVAVDPVHVGDNRRLDLESANGLMAITDGKVVSVRF
jgi:hypothetical protein